MNINKEKKQNQSDIKKILFLLVLVCIVLYLPGINGGFIFDDRPNIVQNSSIHIESIKDINSLLYAAYSFEPGNSSRPLAMLSFAIDYWRAGLNPQEFKTTNILIHVCTLIAIYFLTVKLLLINKRPEFTASILALAIAFAWAIHPLQVSSVLYVVQRMQTLSTLFIVLSLISYLSMREHQLDGSDSRHFGMLSALFGLMAFSSKEDAVLIPVYFLAIELLIFKFNANTKKITKILKSLYGTLAALGILIFVIYILPNHWSWESYAGRDFSSTERLMTQGRVLALYLVQIIFPAPDLMRFFYDDIEISKTLFDPINTITSIFLIASIAFTAFKLRKKLPLFTLGITFFFIGHFITSNIIGLELAFEHRNHFPIYGIMLALYDISFSCAKKIGTTNKAIMVITVSIFIGIACITAYRAHLWGDNLRLAKYSVNLSPKSERAWLFLCSTYFEYSNKDPDNQMFDMAISSCEEGASVLPSSALLMNNVVIFKTIKGSIEEENWTDFLVRLESAPASAQNKGILWTTLSNAEIGIIKNHTKVIKTIEIFNKKTTFQPEEYLRIAAYIFNETDEPIKAFNYLKKAIELSGTDYPPIRKMLLELTEAGRQDWVDELIKVEDMDLSQ